MRTSPPHYEDQPSSLWGPALLTMRMHNTMCFTVVPHHEDQPPSPWGPALLTMRTSPPHHEDQPSSPWGPAPLTMRTSPPSPYAIHMVLRWQDIDQWKDAWMGSSTWMHWQSHYSRRDFGRSGSSSRNGSSSSRRWCHALSTYAIGNRGSKPQK